MVEIETRDPETLYPHPYNARLYRQRTPNRRFIEDVDEKMEDPLVINEQGEIIDGVRRWLAVLELDRDSVEVVERSYPSVEEEKKAILRHNDDRDETFSQKIRVALQYEELVAPILEKRMKAGKSLDEQDDDPILKSDEGATALDLASDRVDWGKSKYRQAKAIWERKESGDDQARRLVDRIEDKEDDLTVNGAFEELNEDTEEDIPETRGWAAPKEVAQEKIDVDEPVRAAFPTSVYRFRQFLQKIKPVRGQASEDEADIRLDFYEDEIQAHSVDSKYSFSQEWFGIDMTVDGEGPIQIMIKHSDLADRMKYFDGEIRVELRGPEDSDIASHLVVADSHTVLCLAGLSEAITIPGRSIARREPLDNSPLSNDTS